MISRSVGSDDYYFSKNLSVTSIVNLYLICVLIVIDCYYQRLIVNLYRFMGSLIELECLSSCAVIWKFPQEKIWSKCMTYIICFSFFKDHSSVISLIHVYKFSFHIFWPTFLKVCSRRRSLETVIP